MRIKVKVEKETLKDSLKSTAGLWALVIVLLVIMKLNGDIDWPWVKVLVFLWLVPLVTVTAHHLCVSARCLGLWLKREK